MSRLPLGANIPAFITPDGKGGSTPWVTSCFGPPSKRLSGCDSLSQDGTQCWSDFPSQYCDMSDPGYNTSGGKTIPPGPAYGKGLGDNVQMSIAEYGLTRQPPPTTVVMVPGSLHRGHIFSNTIPNGESCTGCAMALGDGFVSNYRY